MLAKELIDDPFHDEEIPAVLLQIAAQLIAKAQAKEKTKAAPSDRLLDIDETAGRLNLSRSWLYRRSKKLPFAVHNGRRIAFSEKGIEEYIQQKRGRR